ncbi:MAG: hypothetical protein CMP84_13115 [Gammaproteobacteria bacterium]|nr:hypothetical protein [Gammaproteobacteria bacterium]
MSEIFSKPYSKVNRLTAGLLILLLTPLAFASGANINAEAEAVFWNMVIAILVLGTLLASAALPAAALRQWPGRWRYFAAFPLAVLAVWVGLIVAASLGDSNSHRLWPFELFAWAMFNMIYMVIIMTGKRKLDKADAEARQAGDDAA